MRDFETGLHLYRASKYVNLLAEAYNEKNPEEPIPSQIIDIMTESAPLHDIGKIAISDEILKKKGPLTTEEFEIMVEESGNVKTFSLKEVIWNSEGELQYEIYESEDQKHRFIIWND